MSFHPNDAGMFGQRQHHPIAKMPVECDEGSVILHGAFENQCVIRPRLSSLRSAQDIVSRRAQESGQLGPQHLVEITAHVESSRAKGGDFRVQDGMSCVIQNRLNIQARQFRVAA